ncbi:hypothetical protein Tco_1341815 [Tanacetum coccineum]
MVMMMVVGWHGSGVVVVTVGWWRVEERVGESEYGAYRSIDWERVYHAVLNLLQSDQIISSVLLLSVLQDFKVTPNVSHLHAVKRLSHVGTRCFLCNVSEVPVTLDNAHEHRLFRPGQHSSFTFEAINFSASAHYATCDTTPSLAHRSHLEPARPPHLMAKTSLLGNARNKQLYALSSSTEARNDVDDTVPGVGVDQCGGVEMRVVGSGCRAWCEAAGEEGEGNNENAESYSQMRAPFCIGNPEEDLKDYAIIDSGCSGI